MFAIVMLSCSSSLADLAPVKKISEVPKVSIKQTFLKVQVVDLKGQPYKGSSAYGPVVVYLYNVNKSGIKQYKSIEVDEKGIAIFDLGNALFDNVIIDTLVVFAEEGGIPGGSPNIGNKFTETPVVVKVKREAFNNAKVTVVSP